ncbi:HAD family hydrolase, partial [Roseateles sp. GG27B]
MISTNGIEAIRRILVGAGIATCFSHVFSGDVEPRKAVSMRRFLGDQRYAAQRMCSPAYHDGDGGGALDAGEVVLVTDTVGDVAEATEAGVRSVGVTWGMHTEEQLISAGAERVALWPQELVAWLRSGSAAAVCANANANACASAPATGCGVCASPPVLHSARPLADTSRSSKEWEAAGTPTRRPQQLQLRSARSAALADSVSSIVGANKF